MAAQASRSISRKENISWYIVCHRNQTVREDDAELLILSELLLPKTHPRNIPSEDPTGSSSSEGPQASLLNVVCEPSSVFLGLERPKSVDSNFTLLKRVFFGLISKWYPIC